MITVNSLTNYTCLPLNFQIYWSIHKCAHSSMQLEPIFLLFFLHYAAMTTITELAKHVRGTGSIPRTSKLENKSDSLEPLSPSLLCLRWWRIIGRYVWAKVWMAPCHLVFLYRGFAERKYPSATIITPVTENSSGTELRTARGRCWGVWGILKRFILPGWLW